MKTDLFVFVIAEGLLVLLFAVAVAADVFYRLKRKKASLTAEVKRGEKSMNVFYVNFGISTVVFTLIVQVASYQQSSSKDRGVDNPLYRSVSSETQTHLPKLPIHQSACAAIDTPRRSPNMQKVSRHGITRKTAQNTEPRPQLPAFLCRKHAVAGKRYH